MHCILKEAGAYVSQLIKSKDGSLINNNVGIKRKARYANLSNLGVVFTHESCLELGILCTVSTLEGHVNLNKGCGIGCLLVSVEFINKLTHCLSVYVNGRVCRPIIDLNRSGNKMLVGIYLPGLVGIEDITVTNLWLFLFST